MLKLIFFPMPLTSKFKTSALNNSSTSTTKIIIKHGEVNRGKSDTDSKLVQKLSKKVKKPQKPEKII